MPWIERETGDVSHGVGGGYASLNNAAFAPGGVGGWPDRDHIVFTNANDNWLVSMYNRWTSEIARVDFVVNGVTRHVAAPPAARRPYSRSFIRSRMVTPANLVYAGGDHIACWVGSQDETRGLYTTTGLRLLNAGLLGMGPDGAICYKPDYHGNGPSVVRELDGTEWQITPGHAAALQLLGQQRAIWMEGWVVHVTNLPSPAYYTDAQGQGIWKAMAAYAAGQWWICYYSGEKGLVLHPFASASKAFPIMPTGDGWHSISARGHNVIRIAIAKNEAEAPNSIWGYDLDVTTGQATPLPFWPDGQPTTFPFMPMANINAPTPIEPPMPIEPPIEPPITPPVKPPIEPPKPPKPTSPIHSLTRYNMADPQMVHLVGPAGQFAYPDGPNTGPWASEGWRGVKFKPVADDECKWELSFPDGVHAKLKPVATGGMLGMDATKFATNVCQQWYVKATEDGWGGYEALNCYQGYANGTKQVQMDFDDDSGKYSAASLTIVVL